MIRLDDQVVGWLMPDLVGDEKPSPAAFIVYVFLWSRAWKNEWKAEASHQNIANNTGLSKSAVQGAIKRLNKRKFIATVKHGPTSVPEHHVLRPWRTAKSPRRRTTTP